MRDVTSEYVSSSLLSSLSSLFPLFSFTYLEEEEEKEVEEAITFQPAWLIRRPAHHLS